MKLPPVRKRTLLQGRRQRCQEGLLGQAILQMSVCHLLWRIILGNTRRLLHPDKQQRSAPSHSVPFIFLTQSKTQNDFLSEWIRWREQYLSIILGLENPTVPEKCQVCLQANGNIRCLSCQTCHTWCGPCAVRSHVHHPFHRMQQWTGQFYNNITLRCRGRVP